MFRLVVFRPFDGEILSGRIRSSSQEGVHGMILLRASYQMYGYLVSMGFFNDILIPPALLPEDTTL